MSTNGMTSWAVDLANVGAIYPFQGFETAMVVVGVIFWLGWHVWQLKQESDEIDEEMSSDARGEHTQAAIDRY
jgi:DUF2075 family protein